MLNNPSEIEICYKLNPTGTMSRISTLLLPEPEVQDILRVSGV